MWKRKAFFSWKGLAKNFGHLKFFFCNFGGIDYDWSFQGTEDVLALTEMMSESFFWLSGISAS